jgi:tRNA A37 threonylcarbamoyladenosine modification protein TsaB
MILAITASARTARTALLQGDTTLNAEEITADHGMADFIAPMVQRTLQGEKPGLVAVMVGPGSFTGLRAAIAVAIGVGLASGCETVGVTAAEALRIGAEVDGRLLWTAVDSRRARVFLDRGDGFAAFALDGLPGTRERVAVAGDAANAVAAALAARGTDVMLTRLRQPSPFQVAQVGALRHQGKIPPLAAVPLYVDAPEARLPAGGLRPMPV